MKVRGYGVVSVVDIPPFGGHAALHPEEEALTLKFGAKRKATFAAGRHALREALREAGVVDEIVRAPIFRDDRGAPVLPAAIRASIAHKDEVAAAVVGEEGAVATIGIDLEIDDGRDRSSTDALARQVLTERELALLPGEDAARRRALFERFSLKEALYKALDPHVRRYIGFREVELIDGEFGVAAVGAFSCSGCVVDVGRPGIILTLVKVERR